MTTTPADGVAEPSPAAQAAPTPRPSPKTSRPRRRQMSMRSALTAARSTFPLRRDERRHRLGGEPRHRRRERPVAAVSRRSRHRSHRHRAARRVDERR